MPPSARLAGKWTAESWGADTKRMEKKNGKAREALTLCLGIILLGGIICLVRAYRRKNRVAAWHRRSRKR